MLKVLENFVPPLLDAVLLDYQRNVPVAREPEVLSTMEVIVNKLEVNYHITLTAHTMWIFTVQIFMKFSAFLLLLLNSCWYSMLAIKWVKVELW